MMPPCKDCTERVLGCHGQCSKYLTYKTQLDACNANRRRILKEEGDIIATKRRGQKLRSQRYK